MDSSGGRATDTTPLVTCRRGSNGSKPNSDWQRSNRTCTVDFSQNPSLGRWRSKAAEVQDKTNLVEQSGISGIYVYTLPHDFRNPVVPSPVDSAASRTLMKVGMSGSDVIRRFNEQRRTTALPEDP